VSHSIPHRGSYSIKHYSVGNLPGNVSVTNISSTFWPEEVTVVVRETSIIPKAFKKLDGDELVLAVMSKFAKFIETNMDEAILKNWANFVRSIPCRFQLIYNAEAAYMIARQLRENAVSDYENMALTAFQEVYEISTHKVIVVLGSTEDSHVLFWSSNVDIVLCYVICFCCCPLVVSRGSCSGTRVVNANVTGGGGSPSVGGKSTQLEDQLRPPCLSSLGGCRYRSACKSTVRGDVRGSSRSHHKRGLGEVVPRVSHFLLAEEPDER
jgi:hypothetical protein